MCGIYNLMSTELFLRWPSETVPSVAESVVEFLCARGLLTRATDGQVCAPEPNSQESAELRLIGETLRPTLERHFLTLSLLQYSGAGRKTRQQLENDCHLLAQRLALLYTTEAPEYSEKTAFVTLVGHLLEAELLQEDETGLLHFDERITMPLAQAELVLPIETRQTIQRMAAIA